MSRLLGTRKDLATERDYLRALPNAAARAIVSGHIAQAFAIILGVVAAGGGAAWELLSGAWGRGST